jgi:hypothetical protein
VAVVNNGNNLMKTFIFVTKNKDKNNTETHIYTSVTRWLLRMSEALICSLIINIADDWRARGLLGLGFSGEAGRKITSEMLMAVASEGLSRLGLG